MILPRGNEILYPEQWTDLTSAVVPGIDNIYKISTYGRIYNMKTGHCWKHISQQYDFSKAYSRRVLSQEQLDLLYKTFETNLTISTKDAAKLLGVDLNIVNEKNFISIVTYHRNKYKKINGK